MLKLIKVRLPFIGDQVDHGSTPEKYLFAAINARGSCIRIENNNTFSPYFISLF
jgi:hypothetical protein